MLPDGCYTDRSPPPTPPLVPTSTPGAFRVRAHLHRFDIESVQMCHRGDLPRVGRGSGESGSGRRRTGQRSSGPTPLETSRPESNA